MVVVLVAWQRSSCPLNSDTWSRLLLSSVSCSADIVSGSHRLSITQTSVFMSDLGPPGRCHVQVRRHLHAEQGLHSSTNLWSISEFSSYSAALANLPVERQPLGSSTSSRITGCHLSTPLYALVRKMTHSAGLQLDNMSIYSKNTRNGPYRPWTFMPNMGS